MDMNEMLEYLPVMAMPIDFKSLENEGVLEKSGAWYLIHKVDELPDHVMKKRNAMNAEAGVLRMKSDSHVKYAAMLKKAGG